MEKYIEQLLMDIEQRIGSAPPPRGMITSKNGKMIVGGETDIDAHIDEVERYISSPPAPLGEQLNMMKCEFPDPAKLDEDQLKRLSDAMQEMWISWHLVPDFPAKLPAEIRYRLMRDYMDKEIVLVSYGEVHVEFCDYDKNNCPFEGYCTACDEVDEKGYPIISG